MEGSSSEQQQQQQLQKRQHSSARRLEGMLKANKAELVRLQHQLRAFQREHEKDMRKIMAMVQQQQQQQQQQGPDQKVSDHACSQGIPVMQPIGYLDSCFRTKNGTPRQGKICKTSMARLKITSPFTSGAHSLEGLEDFSHVWIMFYFHENRSTSVKAKVAPPRLGGRRTGVFATRSPHRPNAIGLSLVKLERIEGDELVLSGVDIVHGTPILDVKPYIPEYDDMPDANVPDWLANPPQPPLAISFTQEATSQLHAIGLKTKNMMPIEDAKQAIADTVSQDPRSTYRKTKTPMEIYWFTFDCMDIRCEFSDMSAKIVEVVLLDDRKSLKSG